MRGDCQIIEGKLCYAFDVSDEWLEKLNSRSRFYKGKDEWKVKSIVDGVAWCYLLNPFPSHDNEFNQITKRLDRIEGWIEEVIKEENARSYRAMIEKPTLATRIKCFINSVTYRLFGIKVFKVKYSEAYRVDLYPIFR